jgi:hypothetical protein
MCHIFKPSCKFRGCSRCAADKFKMPVLFLKTFLVVFSHLLIFFLTFLFRSLLIVNNTNINKNEI